MRAGVAIALLVAAPAEALAAPSLAELLADAERAAEVREQDALTAQARRDATAAGLALAPSVSGTTAYTFNQHEVKVQFPSASGGFETVLITPGNQIDFDLQGTVPLIDVGAWLRTSAAKARARAQGATADDVRITIGREVVAAYWQHAAAAALLDAARVDRESALRDRDRAAARAQAGLGTALDLAQAEAAVAQVDQQAAEAERSLRSAVRTLRALTGRDLDPADPPPLPGDVGPEAPLDAWTAEVDDLPVVRAALERARAAHADTVATAAAILPSIEGFAGERGTNAIGFGYPWNFRAGVQARWDLSAQRGADVASSKAAEAAALAVVDRVRRDAADDIAEAWDRVEALRARAVAARAAEDARRRGAADARAREAAGSGTVDDLLRAERDLAQAVATRVQAEGDLAAARAELRLLAGREVAP